MTTVTDYLYLAVAFERPPLAVMPTESTFDEMITAVRLSAANAAEDELRRRYAGAA